MYISHAQIRRQAVQTSHHALAHLVQTSGVHAGRTVQYSSTINNKRSLARTRHVQLARAPDTGRVGGLRAYATVDFDERVRKHGVFLRQKGVPILESQRWARAPGPGSNRPAEKVAPGPGAYQNYTRSWGPEGGYMGTARGFRNNA